MTTSLSDDANRESLMSRVLHVLISCTVKISFCSLQFNNEGITITLFTSYHRISSLKMFLIKLYALEINQHRTMDAAEIFSADVLTFHMLASFPYTTAILFTLFLWMCSRSFSFNSSATKPIKELSGVCAARRQCQEKMVNGDAADLQTAEQKYIMHCNAMHCFSWQF